MNRIMIYTAILAAFVLLPVLNGGDTDCVFTAPNCRIAGGNLQYTQGIDAPAGVFGGKLKAVFQLDGALKADAWGVSLWVKPLNWQPRCENFVFFLTMQGEKADNQPVDLIISKFCKQTFLAFNLRDPQAHNFRHGVALWETGAWHHVAITFNRGTYQYYLDGEPIGENKSMKAIGWKTMIIGTPYDSWGYIGEEQTAIGNVKRYSDSPSAERIREEYRHGFQIIADREKEHGGKPRAEYSFDAAATPAGARTIGKISEAEGIAGRGVSADGGMLNVAAGELLGDGKRGTVAMWVRPQWTPATDDCYFFCLLSAPGKRLLLYKPHKTAAVRLIYQDLSEKSQKWTEHEVRSWRENEWHHLAFTWDDGLYTLYVDGKSVGSVNGVPAMKADHILFGKVLPGWGGLGAASTVYDEIKLYDRPLPPAEVNTLYSHFAPAKPAASQKTVPDSPNLATEKNRCIGLASSFGNYQQSYTDNLFDGDPSTFWQAKDPGEPLFLELRWPFPRRVDQLFLRDLSGNLRQVRLESYSGSDDTWKTVKTFQPAEFADGSFTFPEQGTTRLRLHLLPAPGQKAAASAFEAYGPKQPGTDIRKPYWDAWYIWYPEPDKLHKAAQPRYFRKTFQLDKLPESAVVQARSNDYYKIFVNGTEVDTGSIEIRPRQVAKLLKKGENVIAAEANLSRNPGKWGWGEFIAELSLNYPDGTVKIGTGEDWKSSDRSRPGWNEAGKGFDDSAWLAPFCYKRPPEGPWGKISYYPTDICEQADADGKVPVYRAKHGDTVKISFNFTPRHRLNQNYDFLLEAGSDVPGLRGDRHLFATMYTDAPATKGNGGPVTVTADLTLPPWTPSGRQPVYLSAAGQENGLALNINNASKIKIAEIEVAAPAVPSSGTGIAEAKIGYPNGQAAFLLDNHATTPFFWRYISLADPERLYMTEHYSGIRIHQFLLYGKLVDAGPNAWAERFAELDRNIRTLLGVNPQALVVILWDLRPTLRWLQQNPDEMLITAFGKKEGVSFSSAKYRNECLTFTRSLIDYLKSQPYWDRIVGFHPWTCGMPDSVTGGVAENLWQTDRAKITVGDFNPQAMKMFRDFLRRRYLNNVEELRRAWRHPEITFDTATPEIGELTAPGVNDGVFRDPAAGRMAFDYMDFVPTMLSSLILDMCRLTKEMTGGTRINFVHYGFLIAHMQAYNSPGGMFNNNNFDLAELLNDPAIDGYIGAASYSGRLAGTPFLTYFPWSSFRLHGRMYLPDDDTRHYQAATRNYGHTRGLRESQAIIRRNLGADITRNFGSWFADMSQGEGALAVSWTGEREIAEMIGEMNRLYRQAQQIGYRSAAEIAVIFSAKSPRYLDMFHGPTLSNNLINWMYYPEFFRLGAPFDVYLASDLHHPDFPRQYKLYVMMNTFYLSDADRKRIEELKKDGTTFLWFYAPGYVGDNGLDVRQIEALTGIRTEVLPGKEKMTAVLQHHRLAEGMPESGRLGAAGFPAPATRRMHADEFGPKFRIVDPKAETAAQFADGKAALAFRDFGTWKSVYSVIPRLERPVLRNICRLAGVHLYTDADIVFDANRNFMVLHNGYDKERSFTLSLPRRTTVRDAFSDKIVVKNSDSIPVRMEPCSTLIYRLED